jgi:SAM-dependent methyltransferase
MIFNQIYLSLLSKYKNLKKIIHLIFDENISKFSYVENYKVIVNPDRIFLKKKYNIVWKNKSVPKIQWRIVSSQLQKPLNVKHFQDTIDLIKQTRMNHPSILEVGCSSGYHAEVFKKAGLKISYTGCDYSKAFIDHRNGKISKPHF